MPLRALTGAASSSSIGRIESLAAEAARRYNPLLPSRAGDLNQSSGRGEIWRNVSNVPIVLHERLGYWARHLRPRLHGWPVRWVESRSADDLSSALTGTCCPIVLIDTGQWPRSGLEDLARAARTAPSALIAVLDAEALPGVVPLARELGATHVISGVATPPVVVDLLTRWIPVARRRRDGQGWSREIPPEPEPEPWSWLTPLLNEPARPLR